MRPPLTASRFRSLPSSALAPMGILLVTLCTSCQPIRDSSHVLPDPVLLGATPNDASDDDSLAINKCLMLHGSCKLPEGIFHIARPILLRKHGSKLSGMGPGKTILKLKKNMKWGPAAASWFPAVQSYPFPSGQNSCRVSSMTIDLNGDGQLDREKCLRAVVLWGSSNTIDEVEAVGFRPGLRNECFVLSAEGGDHNTISRSVVHSPASTAGTRYPDQWTPEITAFLCRGEIRNCTAYDLKRPGNANATHAFTPGGANPVIRECHSKGGDVGVWVQMPDMRTVTVTGNTLLDRQGIALADAEGGHVINHVEISGNTFRNNDFSLYFFCETRRDNGSFIRSVTFRNNDCADGEVVLFLNRPSAYDRFAILNNTLRQVRVRINHRFDPSKFHIADNVTADGKPSPRIAFDSRGAGSRVAW